MSFNHIAPDLVLKTTPPRVSKGLLFRGRLSSDALEYRRKAIVEIHAPAGFGKTSLLEQWRKEFLNRGHLVAWLTFDERDDSLRLARGLAYAMRLASGKPVFERSLVQSLHQVSGDLEGLTSWLAEVANLGTKTLLVLDEVQLAPLRTIQQSLLYLFRNAPPNLRVVLASRKRLELELSDLQARGLYGHIGPEQLRFALQDTINVLSSRLSTQLSPEDSARLHEKTAGWPLGLQIAITAIELNPGASIETMTATSEGFDAYFHEHLFSRLDKDVADFLVSIAALDAVNSDLCRAITHKDDAGELLDRLRESLPIFTDGENVDWTRIHPMAHEFLRRRLEKKPASERQLLHERAAKWFANRQMYEEAASHALVAEMKEFAYELIGKCLRSVLLSGHQARVLHWLDHVPDTELQRHPSILLGAAWALAQSDRHDEAPLLAKSVATNPEATGDERLESALISATAAYFADQMDETSLIIAPWRQADVTDSLELRSIRANVTALLLVYEGEPEQARRLIRTSLAKWPSGVDNVRAWGEWLVGFSYLWEGQAQLAHDCFHDSLLRFEDALGRRASLSVMFASALSRSLWEIGKPTEAAEMLIDRLDVLERASTPESISMGYQTAARAAAFMGQERRALDLLENLFALGKERNLLRLIITSLAEQIRMHALQGRADACRSTCKRLESLVSSWAKSPQGLLQPVLSLRTSIALAFGALAARDWDHMATILGSAQNLTDRLRRGRENIEIKLLAALAANHQGKDASPQVLEMMSLAKVYGLKGTLVDLHPDLFGWVREMRKTNEDTSPIALPSSQQEARAKDSHRIPAANTSGLLTTKEVEVLHLLEKSFSNKQIATTLGVSNETIKWHIKNLFGKLNAGSRKHVVDRARMLGILPESD